ncbi:protein FAF-like, chloroplastic [Primulina huaijiensis]|uniref:protein FAF-like, chloroplastic n=1 Tax=Primulina huaijiensis TaxID=1492673 RepID=UPI003CC73E48
MPMRNKSFHYLSSSSPINELEEESPTKQGIGTILTSDCERTKNSSLRRTLSADMSSKKWLEQNGFFSPVKKIASSGELGNSVESSSVSSSEDEQGYEKCPGQDEVWASILSHKVRNGIQKPEQMDVWGSILVQKSETCSSVPPPYVHPLVKRSSITLSEQSLDMCTECIGSETGSDGFCSEILSDVGQEEVKELNSVGDFHLPNSRKAMATPLPPPLSFISSDGASIYMRSHRKNGRLILEAVSVPSRNCFQAHRGDGRLVLSFMDDHTPQEGSEDMEDNESWIDEVFDNTEEAFDQGIVDSGSCDGGEEEKEEERVAEEKFQVNNAGKVVHFVADQSSTSLPRLVSVQKSGLMMKNMMGLRNKAMNLEAEVPVEELQIPEPLPLRPRVPRSISYPQIPPSSFNTYEYFWRNKAAVCDGVVNSIIATTQSTPIKTNNNCKAKGTKSQDLVLMRGNKTEYFVPYLKGCKEFPRSLLIWEPCSIVTS